MKVYISGPIYENQDQTYREIIKEFLEEQNIEYYDPWVAGTEIRKLFWEAYNKLMDGKINLTDYLKVSRKLVSNDLKNLDSCDTIVAYINKQTTGTAMEIMYAFLKKKTIIIINEWFPHPFHLVFADEIYDSIENWKLSWRLRNVGLIS